MPDDDENVVRQRLLRLSGHAAPDGPVPHPAGAEPVRQSARAGKWVPAGAARPPSGPAGPELPPAARTAPPAPAGPRRPGPTPQETTPQETTPPPARPRPPAQGTDDGPPEPSSARLPGPGAFDPGRRGVRALAAVAVLVVLGAGLWAWRSRPQAEPVRPVAGDTAPLAAGSVESAGAGPAAAGVTAPAELVVAVAGRVRRPGLVRVPAGARVADVVEAAGGALPGVDVALLNPARKVADGELILVGVTPPPGAPAAPGGGAAPPAGAPVPGGKVDLNTATLAQLDALPGVGPVLAQRILAHRDQHGRFRSVSDLRQVEGIGDTRYEQLKDLVTV